MRNIGLKPEEFKEFLISWNNTFPLDYWYRKKYGIPFGSPKHREANFIDIKIEYEEELLFKEHYKNKERRIKDAEDLKIFGNVLRKPKSKILTEEEQIKLFDSIEDLSQFDDKPETQPK